MTNTPESPTALIQCAVLRGACGNQVLVFGAVGSEADLKMLEQAIPEITVLQFCFQDTLFTEIEKWQNVLAGNPAAEPVVPPES